MAALMAKRATVPLSRHAILLPFVFVAGFGLFVLIGWWGGQATWVQPRPHDVPLPANAALCLFLIGLCVTAAHFEFRRLALAVVFLVLTISGVALIDSLLHARLGLDDLLVSHGTVVEGASVGRIPSALAAIFLACGLILAWQALNPTGGNRSIALAMAASLSGAYGFTALMAGRIGLSQVSLWQEHAHLGPHTATALLILAFALGLLAAREETLPGRRTGPQWLWLPVVAAGATVTLLFWVSLREREITYLNSTTQLSINNIAALFQAESETQINNLDRMAARWTASGGTPQESWEKDARAHFTDFAAYRSISWVDSNYRTRWLWPRRGNEDAIAFDHTRHPLRLQAMRDSRESLTYAVAGPLVSPVQPPGFAVYATVLNAGGFDGFIVGELGYQQLFFLIDRRLDLSRRYLIQITVNNPEAAQGQPAEISVFESSSEDADPNPRVRQSVAFNISKQRFTITLTPRIDYFRPNRQFLPEIALVAGLGVSALLGLVVNLAQSARTRQRAAEYTSTQLRKENEERRRIEGRLKVADERLNLALDATQVGVYEWDLPTGQVIYSASVWTALGYDPAVMPSTQQIWADLMHPDDKAPFNAATTAHFRGETPFIETEYRVRHANGEWVWFAARAKCVAWDRKGQPSRVTGTCQNVTARRQAEEALRASQAATRVLTHVARRTENVVFITTPSGNIQWANDSFTRLTGHQVADVTGCYLLDLLASPDSTPEALDQITQALLRVESITTEVIAKAAGNDRRFHLRLELQPVKNDHGDAENFIAIGTDITTSVQTEATLRRAKSEADAASRAKSEFLATMSHEIRTPMNGVIGMTSLLMETDLSPEQRDYVSTIRTSGDALLSVINEILDFSKIESGKMELENQPFEIAQCIEEALDIFALQAAGKKIELAYHLADDVPAWIMLDATRVRQVLVNLVNNAVKFTVEGQITIEVRLATVPAADSTQAPIPLQDGNRQLIDFFVRDTGIGIPPERRHLLFKPFSQVDSSTTRKYGGTGLGLAICDRLCHLMGGTIDVDANPGGGSLFRFSILAEPLATPEDAGLPPLPPEVRERPVLIVDDLPFNRRVLQQTITRLGLRGLEAAHLYDGTEIALKQPIVAAIIDNELLGEEGAPLAEELRRRHATMPLILLVNPLESAKRTSSQDPYQIRLPKPIKPGQLAHTLHRLLRDGPAKTPTQPPLPTTTGPALGQTIPLEVLLVEDNAVNQKVALRFLKHLGYDADAVGNGLEAVRTLEQRRYDIVFMDVQMPEMDGLTATGRIREQFPADRQPRIIALTANAVQGDRERCLAAGMDDYISKPVKLEEIERVILKFFTHSPDEAS